MANFRRYTMDEIWRPPDGAEGELPPTGCPFVDELCAQIRPSGYRSTGVMAARLGLTTARLTATMETLTGMNYTAWMREWMLRDAEWLLSHTLLTVGQIARQMGYASRSNFCQSFLRYRKCTPGSYRRAHRTLRRYTTVEIIAR